MIRAYWSLQILFILTTEVYKLVEDSSYNVVKASQLLSARVYDMQCKMWWMVYMHDLQLQLHNHCFFLPFPHHHYYQEIGSHWASYGTVTVHEHYSLRFFVHKPSLWLSHDGIKQSQKSLRLAANLVQTKASIYCMGVFPGNLVDN